MKNGQLEKRLRAEVLGHVNDMRSDWGKEDLSEIPDEVWNDPRVRSLVVLYINQPDRVPDDEGLSIARSVNTYINDGTARGGHRGGRPAGIERAVMIEESPEETACREAAEDYISRYLNRQIEVQHFRSLLPTRKVLASLEDMKDLLSSQAAKHSTFEQLEAWDVCPISAPAVVLSQKAVSKPVETDFNTFLIRSAVQRALNPTVQVTISLTN